MRIRKRFSVLRSVPILLAFGLLAVRAEAASAAAAAALQQCLAAVIPGLFPFFVLSGLLLRLGSGTGQGWAGRLFSRLFHIRGSALPVFLLSLVSGYPVGASSAAALYARGGCTREEAERLLLFSNNCGPGFLLGLTARVLDEPEQAVVLLLLQWGVSLWLGILLGVGKAGSRGMASAPLPPEQFSRAFPESVVKAGRSVLVVCAYVLFFAVTAAFLPQLPLLRGMLELTGGMLLLEGRANAFPTAAFLTGFGGLAVSAQVWNAAEEGGLRAAAYPFVRLLHGATCWCLALLWELSPVLLLPAAFLLFLSLLFANRAGKRSGNAV